jgi:arylsulfatase A-like enzyme
MITLIRITLLPALLGIGLAAPVFAKERPNIILVLADDLGWADTDLDGPGYYETPSLRRLAEEGLRFTHGYAASPLCSPTRASIMVGQSPARLRMTEAITAKRQVFEPKALPPEDGQYAGDIRSRDHLPANLRTLADLLKESGYQTAHIGKWHLSRPNQFRQENETIYDAGNRGFDFVIGGNHAPGPGDYYSPYAWSPKNREARRSDIPGLEAGPDGEHLDRRLVEEAVEWIDKVKDSDRPFFLNLWLYAVHSPYVPRKDLIEKYRSKTDPRGIHDSPVMGTMVESLDQSLGVLLDFLDRPENRALRDNTLLIFLSDNGGVIHDEVNGRQVTSNRPLRGGKANTFEGGVRVPWIVAFPGHIKPGTVSDVPVISTDLFPTILDFAGVSLPEGQAVDGVSLRPVFTGGTLPERPLFFDFPSRFGILCAPSSAVRMGDEKLLRFYWAGDEPGTHYYELYDLAADPGEAVNLAAHRPDRVRELDALIEAHLRESDALIPLRNENFTGSPRTSRASGRTGTRPASLHLEESTITPQEDRGTRVVRLQDEGGRPVATSGVVVDGGNWVTAENLPNGSVEVRWDRTKGSGEATILLGWAGGRTIWEINDWTLNPVELTIR